MDFRARISFSWIRSSGSGLVMLADAVSWRTYQRGSPTITCWILILRACCASLMAVLSPALTFPGIRT